MNLFDIYKVKDEMQGNFVNKTVAKSILSN